MIFTRQTGDDDHEFVSKGEDPVTATLTGDERYHLERRAGGLHGRILQTQSCPWIHFYPSLLGSFCRETSGLDGGDPSYLDGLGTKCQ